MILAAKELDPKTRSEIELVYQLESYFHSTASTKPDLTNMVSPVVKKSGVEKTTDNPLNSGS